MSKAQGRKAHSNLQNVFHFYLFLLHFMICTMYFVVLKLPNLKTKATIQISGKKKKKAVALS